MKKFILIPDSFKGTITSLEICEIMKSALLQGFPNAEIISIPVADGGEGTVDAFLSALGGTKETVRVQNPFGEEIDAFYGKIGDVAVVEMAAAAGLPLVANRRNPLRASTYGVGQLMQASLQNGAKTLIIGLGGSATNDGGAGAAAALGVRFYNKANETFVPTGETLHEISHIDCAPAKAHLQNIRMVVMCDIDNPLCGKRGAAAVFGPQKGADEKTVSLLDAGLFHLGTCFKNQMGVDVFSLAGSGAAGGMGGGLHAFFGATLCSGINTILDTVKFDSLLTGTTAVFTGEGRIDGQSLGGKVVVGVGKRCKPHNIPVFAIVGDIADDAHAVYEHGITGIFSINRLAIPFSKAKPRAKEDLRHTMDNLVRCAVQCCL